MKIWDTSGQEKFQVITPSMYRNSKGIIIVFDLTNKKSFEKIHKWLTSIKLHTNPKNLAVFLLGNKADMWEERVIDYEKAKDIADANNIEYYETSAISGENVNKAFEEISRVAYEKTKSGLMKESFHLNNRKSFKRKMKAKQQCC